MDNDNEGPTPNDPLRDLPPPRPSSRRLRRRGGDPDSGGSGRGAWLVLLLVAAAGFGWWWFGLRGESDAGLTAPDPGRATLDTALVGDDRGLTGPVEPLDLPPLDESDGLIRRLAETLSAHPRWSRWLVSDRLVERFVLSVVTLAAGNSPREQVPFLVPDGDFRVRTQGDALVIDPASYRRYDAFAEALVGLERNGVVRLYRQLRPLFIEAYTDLGFPPDDFDAHVARAMDNLIAVPVLDGPFEVQQGVEVYEYADPALEVMTPAEKHMLRLGPENALRVQAKLRQLRAALVAAGALPAEG